MDLVAIDRIEANREASEKWDSAPWLEQKGKLKVQVPQGSYRLRKSVSTSQLRSIANNGKIDIEARTNKRTMGQCRTSGDVTENISVWYTTKARWWVQHCPPFVYKRLGISHQLELFFPHHQPTSLPQHQSLHLPTTLLVYTFLYKLFTTFTMNFSAYFAVAIAMALGAQAQCLPNGGKAAPDASPWIHTNNSGRQHLQHRRPLLLQRQLLHGARLGVRCLPVNLNTTRFTCAWHATRRTLSGDAVSTTFSGLLTVIIQRGNTGDDGVCGGGWAGWKIQKIAAVKYLDHNSILWVQQDDSIAHLWLWWWLAPRSTQGLCWQCRHFAPTDFYRYCYATSFKYKFCRQFLILYTIGVEHRPPILIANTKLLAGKATTLRPCWY